MLRNTLFLIGCVLPCLGLAGPAAAQEDASRPLMTLDDALRLAYENNVAIRMARNEAAIAANDHSIGNAGFLPSVSLSAQQSRRSIGGFSNGSEGFGTANSFDLAMNVNATLFDGFGQFAAYDRLASQQEYAALAADHTVEATLADVVVGYFDLVRLQEQVEVLRETVALSEERLRIAELRRDVGTASELEARRARVDLNADRAALLRQELALANARTSFTQLLAYDGFDYRVADTIHVDRSLRPEELRATAPAQNKTLRVARQARETATLTRRELRTEWFPTVSLQAGYAFNELPREMGLPVNRPAGFSYGLAATWSMFDGFDRRRRLQNADLRLRNSDLAVQEAATQLDARFDNAALTYRNSLELVDLERENVSLAALNVEVALERFRQGTITSIELREVQTALAGTESRFINAQFEAKRAEVELRQLSGTLQARYPASR